MATAKSTLSDMGTYDVYVGRIPKSLTKPHLYKIFQEYGEVCDCYIFPFKADHKYTYSFVRFYELNAALRAVKEGNGWPVENSKLEVDFTKKTKREMRKLMIDQDEKLENVTGSHMQNGPKGNTPDVKHLQKQNGEKDDNYGAKGAASKESRKYEIMTKVVLSKLRDEVGVLGSDEQLLTRCDMRKMTELKYEKHLQLVIPDSCELPEKYRFVDTESGTMTHFNNIVYDERKSSEHFVCPPHCQNKWHQFSSQGRDHIFVLLAQILSVSWYAERKSKSWRTSLIYDSDDRPHGIKSYGGAVIHEIVLGNRTKEQYLATAYGGLEDITFKFVSALQQKMSGGAAYDAVYTLLNCLRKIFQAEYPENIINVYYGDGGFSKPSVARRMSCSSDEALSSVSNSGTLPSVSFETKHNGNSSKSSGLSYGSVSPSNCTLYERQGVDLHMMCSDEFAEGKYMLLVELNGQKTKLIKELMLCLQGQDNVFGLLISDTEAELIRLHRTCALDNVIQVGQKAYDFLQPTEFFGTYIFDAKDMQELCMDIVTTMVFSLETLRSV